MARKNAMDGTLFMAFEAGAAWPEHLYDLKGCEGNFQAVVQANGETAEHFAGRALQRWYRLRDSSAPPHRFILSTNANSDDRTAAARKRIAHEVFVGNAESGKNELILWSSDVGTGAEQGRLLELAGTLLAGHAGSARSIRVLFGDSNPYVQPRSRIGEFHAA